MAPDTEEASGSRAESMGQDAPCTRGSQRHRPAHTPDLGFQPPQGTRPVSVLLQPQVPGSPSTHVWALPPTHSCHGEELPLDSLLLTPTPTPCSATPTQALESSSSIGPQAGFPSSLGSGAHP